MSQPTATNRILPLLAHTPATWQNKGMDTYTVGQAAKLAGIGPSTARDYLKAHPAFFSEEATPPAGTRRALVWPDIETLATIRSLKKKGKAAEEINATLATGDRDSIQPQATGPGSALIVRLSAAVAQWEATAHTVVDERDHLRTQLKDSQAARLAAEIRAATAETKLQVLEDAKIETAMQKEKPGFWQRVFGRG